MKRPQKGEYAPGHSAYIHLLPPRKSAHTILRESWKTTVNQFGQLTDAQANMPYATGKWTYKQLLIHLIDTERVFAFRILWFLRGDRAPLPGFNQDFWMAYSPVSQRSVKDLLKEFKLVRDHTLLLLKNCSEDQALLRGKAGIYEGSVRAYFFIIAGHHLHHLYQLKSAATAP